MASFKSQLKEKEWKLINTGCSMDDVLARVSDERKVYDKKMIPTIMRKCNPVLEHVQSFCAVIDTFVASNPVISGLIWGSLKFILDVRPISLRIYRNSEH